MKNWKRGKTTCYDFFGPPPPGGPFRIKNFEKIWPWGPIKIKNFYYRCSI